MFSPAYIWDNLDEKNVDYRIYGENYFLFTRAYKIFTELYGAEGELSKKFYAKVVDTAAPGADRAQGVHELAGDGAVWLRFPCVVGPPDRDTEKSGACLDPSSRDSDYACEWQAY